MKEGSYMLIRPGMNVVGPEGRAGSVSEVVADSAVDVFRGIVVAHGLMGRRAFVDQSHVVAVVDDTVEIDLTPAEVGALPEAATVAQAS